MSRPDLWLAPLRGVTIRAFREAFAAPLREAGFAGAYAPFIPANPGIRVNDRMLADLGATGLPLVPQVITKDPAAMRELLKGFKERGFARADLNAGCPFPMIRRRGRGSGLFRTPDVLERLLEAGCDEMGPGNFSVKMRLGLERPDEILALMPMLNRYPLAVLTIHARTARQMYEGPCDLAAFLSAARLSTNPVMYNGDLVLSEVLSAECLVQREVLSAECLVLSAEEENDQRSKISTLNNAPSTKHQAPSTKHQALSTFPLMVGRGFVRALGARDDSAALLRRYIEISRGELSGDHPVLGRVKELVAYWTAAPRWRRLWPLVKISRSIDELLSLVQS